MEQEFSLPRLLRALADAWVPTKELKEMIPKVLALLSFLGIGSEALFKPEKISLVSLEGKVVLVLLLVSAFIVPVIVAYRLRCQLDAFLAIPESDRNLILELKAVAGEAFHHCTGLLSLSSKEQARDSTDRLRVIMSKLRQYEGIYNAAFQLSDALFAWSVTDITLGDYERMEGSIAPIYRRVLAQCDAVLKPTKDPVPSAASEQAPPS